MGWLGLIIGPITNMIMNIFNRSSDNAAKKEEAQSKAQEATANAKAEESKVQQEVEKKNAALGTNDSKIRNKIMYSVLLVFVVLMGIAGFYPEFALGFWTNVRTVFSDDILRVFLEMLKSIFGIVE